MDESYTLHDGTKLPKGSQFAFPVLAIQLDPANYENATIFDGYRFVKRDERDRTRASTLASTTVTVDFLPYAFAHMAHLLVVGLLVAVLDTANTRALDGFSASWKPSLSSQNYYWISTLNGPSRCLYVRQIFQSKEWCHPIRPKQSRLRPEQRDGQSTRSYS